MTEFRIRTLSHVERLKRNHNSLFLLVKTRDHGPGEPPFAAVLEHREIDTRYEGYKGEWQEVPILGVWES